MSAMGRVATPDSAAAADVGLYFNAGALPTLTLGLVFLGFSGLGISIWPHIIPPAITLWQAAAPPQSQGFMLVGALLIIPVILGYTCWSYYVFRGKVQPGEGYH